MNFPACLAFLLAALVPGFAAASQPAGLPFNLTSHGAIIVPVSINGLAPVSFLLDTGSNGSVISDQLASSLGAAVVARTTIVSGGGQKDALVARIEHLTMGFASADGLLATIVSTADLNMPDVAASGHTVQGVVGQDVLGGLRYTIDYRTRRILWREAGADAPRQASRLELEAQDDRFVVRLRHGDRDLRLVPDSGAEALVLFDAAETVADPAPAAAVGLTGLAGSCAARPAIVRTLKVGMTTLTNVPAVIVKRETAARSVDGLLPMHLFARVTFNGPEHQLFIEAR